VSRGIQFSIPPLWVVGLDDHSGLLLSESPFGFILRKCGLPYPIHRHSFVGRCQVAFSFPSLLCGLSVQMTTAIAMVGIAFQASSFEMHLADFDSSALICWEVLGGI
jgi:hypothetical protein